MSFLIKIILFLLVLNLVSAKTVITTGIAYPQSKREINNIEILRSRAIDNAKKEAITFVLGELVNVKRVSNKYIKENDSYNNKKNKITIQQELSNKNSIFSISYGYTKLISILKEEFNTKGYYIIKAKIDVMEKNISNQLIKSYWKRAGSPLISIILYEYTNEKSSSDYIDRSNKYFTKLFNDNGLSIIKEEEKNSYLSIKITQTFTQNQYEEYGTISTKCQLSYTISDIYLSKELKSYYSASEPIASFSEKNGKLRCIQSVIKNFSKKLMRDLVDIFNNQSLNGSEFIVTISGLKGKDVIKISNLFKEIFHLDLSNIRKYQNSKLSFHFKYIGNNQELIESIQSTMKMNSIELTLTQIEKNKIYFKYKGKK